MVRGLRWVVLAGAAGSLGCGDPPGAPSGTPADGRILIQVSTSGAAPESEQYLVTLDGARPLAVTPNGSASYDEVPEGTHVVHLFSLADNCAVSGASSPRSVEVGDGDVARVGFSVVCGAPITGGFVVAVVTSGTETDEDGYQLSVAGTPLRLIPVNAEETYQGLEPGVHLVTLKDVADVCEVRGGNPQPYTVVPGKSVVVTIRVACGQGEGPLN